MAEEIQEIEKIQKRPGNTRITSVSLSKEFNQLMKDYNISPTDAIRRGIGLILYERGVPQFQSQLNQERYKLLQKIIKMQQLIDLPEKIKQVEAMLCETRTILEGLLKEEIR